MDEIIKPGDLKKAAVAIQMARAQEIAAADKRRADERAELKEAFMNRQIREDVRARLTAALRAAADRGEDHFQIFTFPSQLCTDGGRAINNSDPDWPKTLDGFAKLPMNFTWLSCNRTATGCVPRPIFRADSGRGSNYTSREPGPSGGARQSSRKN